MRVVIVSVGEANTPSTYYRFGQFLPLLEKEGIFCTILSKEEISWNHLDKFDLIINQKAPIAPIRLSRPLLFDFDDAIWTRSGRPYSWWTKRRVEKRLKGWLEMSVCTTVANGYLKEYASKSAKRVEKIPMALDLERWTPKKEREEILIGWSGHPVNIPYLERIEPDLKRVLEKYPRAKLAVHSGERPRLSIPYRYIPFKPGDEPSFIRSLSIGLLPLAEDEYTKGKSPIKALQYLACGVPIVGPAFGATEEIHSEVHGVVVNQRDWFYALSSALDNPQKMRFLGEQGRAFMERHHSYEKVGRTLASVIKSCA